MLWDVSFRKAKRPKPDDWVSYKRLRNDTQEQICNSKTRCYFCSFSSCKQSYRELLSEVKELGIAKPVTINQLLLTNTINLYLDNIPVNLIGACPYISQADRLPSTHAFGGPQFSFFPVKEYSYSTNSTYFNIY